MKIFLVLYDIDYNVIHKSVVDLPIIPNINDLIYNVCNRSVVRVTDRVLDPKASHDVEKLEIRVK